MYYLLKVLEKILFICSNNVYSWLAHILTFLSFDILKIRKNIILKNLNIAFGDSYSYEQKLQIAKKSVYHFFLTIIENLGSKQHEIIDNTEVVGIDYIYNCLNKNKGVFVLCCHMGNWEFAGVKISIIAAPLYALSKTQMGSKGFHKFIIEKRLKNGVQTLSRGSKGNTYRQMLKVLKDSSIIAFMIDQSRPKEPRINFFNYPAKTNTSLARIARKHDIPVVPVFVKRIGIKKTYLEFWPQLNIIKSLDEEDDAIKNTQLFNLTIEKMIQLNPEQYFWMHNRWK